MITSCLLGWYCSSWSAQLGKTVDALMPPAFCTALSRTVQHCETQRAGRKLPAYFQLDFSVVLMQHMASSAIKFFQLILVGTQKKWQEADCWGEKGDSVASLTNNSYGGVSYLTRGFLFSEPLLLGLGSPSLVWDLSAHALSVFQLYCR